MVFIPDDWVVHGLYQTYEKNENNEYTILNEQRSGYFKFKTGMNLLRTDQYYLYKDKRLSSYFRKTIEGDNGDKMNDKLQGLYIFKAGKGEIIIWDHESESHEKQLRIKLN